MLPVFLHDLLYREGLYSEVTLKQQERDDILPQGVEAFRKNKEMQRL